MQCCLILCKLARQPWSRHDPTGMAPSRYGGLPRQGHELISVLLMSLSLGKLVAMKHNPVDYD